MVCRPNAHEGVFIFPFGEDSINLEVSKKRRNICNYCPKA